jgi:hypothetical protein
MKRISSTSMQYLLHTGTHNAQTVTMLHSARRITWSKKTGERQIGSRKGRQKERRTTRSGGPRALRDTSRKIQSRQLKSILPKEKHDYGMTATAREQRRRKLYASRRPPAFSPWRPCVVRGFFLAQRLYLSAVQPRAVMKEARKTDRDGVTGKERRKRGRKESRKGGGTRRRLMLTSKEQCRAQTHSRRIAGTRDHSEHCVICEVT